MEYYSPVSGGAIATVTAQVVRQLQSMGHLVDVVAADCDDPVYGQGDVHLLRYRSLGALPRMLSNLEARCCGWDFPDQGRFHAAGLEILAKLRPDVVVLANELARVASVRRVLPGVQIAVWVHNECHLPRNTLGIFKQANVFLCCSDYIREWMLHHYCLNPAAVHTAHAGIDRDIFYPAHEDPSQGELRVLFTGRLDPNKGVDIAVDVVSRLRQKGLRIRLCVAGNTWFYAQTGTDTDPFQQKLRSAMREGGVDWLGHVPRRFLPEVMRGHDVALVPSRSQEPFGLVVLESMASGLAVVASARGGLPEACGDAGILVEPEDRSQIERVLTRFATDPPNLSGWKSRSLGRVKAADWRATADVLCRAVGIQNRE